MKREIIREIEIPEGVDVVVHGGLISVKGPKGENKREFNVNGLLFEKKDNKIEIGNKKSTKKEKKRIITIAAHIKNLIKGVQEEFEYTLKVCFSHFPITVEIKGNEALIKNFLGEKVPRKMKIPKGAKVEINKDLIKVISSDREIAGQTAANFETATRIRLRDRRVFQDGIFITSKNKEYED